VGGVVNHPDAHPPRSRSWAVLCADDHGLRWRRSSYGYVHLDVDDPDAHPRCVPRDGWPVAVPTASSVCGRCVWLLRRLCRDAHVRESDEYALASRIGAWLAEIAR